MCVLISVWLCALLGLLPLEIQSRALSLQSAHRDRQRPPLPLAPISTAPLTSPKENYPLLGQEEVWRALLHRAPPEAHGGLHGGRSRGRRHVNGVGGRGHLMRVGCVLGTCQVQNLSHRLYQLIGQSGREDSSPINPRSPHSYG